MTVIVVPDAGNRTVTFRFSLAWLLPLVLAFAGLTAAVYIQYQQNQSMHAQLGELDGLRRTNRLQEAQIEGLQHKAEETDQKLSELQALEDQLRDIVGQPAPSRSGSTKATPVHIDGRGGPSATSQTLANMATLSSMLPPDVRAYLFTKRDTLAMDLQQPATRTQPEKSSPETTVGLQTQFEQQLATMSRLATDLVDAQQAVADHLDYVAHVPNGMPLSGGSFTDRYGWRWSPFGWGRQWHDGLDIAQDYGVPVVATGDGVVIHSGWKSGGYGYTVMIDHGYGYVTMYAHLSDTAPDVWQEVKRGDVIGWVGSTGNSTGPHLHYEVHVNGVSVDPVKYMQ